MRFSQKLKTKTNILGQGMSCDGQAQGTIEYLVIVGVVIVLLLFVTTIIISSTDQASQVSSVATKQEMENNILGVRDLYADVNGNNLLTIKNNDSKYITINLVEIGDANFDFGQRLKSGQEKNFIVPSNQTCQNGKKILNITIHYTSRYGLAKVRVLENAEIACQDYSVIDPLTYADTIAPVVTWLSPANGYYTNSSEIDINFTVADFSTITLCELLSGSNVIDSTSLPDRNTQLTLVADPLIGDANNLLKVKCTDLIGNIGYSSDINILYDEKTTSYIIFNGDFSCPSGVTCTTNPTIQNIKTTNNMLEYSGELDINSLADYTYLSSDYNRDLNGLLVYYKFNELNSSGKVIDYAGYDTNGNVTGSSVITTGGMWGTNTSSFDTSTKYISIPSFGNISPTTEISISLWIYVSSVRSQSAFIYSTDNSTNRLNFHPCYSNGYTYWDFGNIQTTGRLHYANPSGCTGQWNHYVLLSSVLGNYMKIYRNGVLEASKTGAGTFTRHANNLQIGGKTSVYMSGMIDEFAIWNRAISESEIINLYNKGVSDLNFTSQIIEIDKENYETIDFNSIKFDTNYIHGSEINPEVEPSLASGLVGLWHLNNDTTDSSDNENDGTWVGTEKYVTGLWDTNVGYFNGGTDYINFSSIQPSISNAYTISAWIFPENNINYSNIIVRGNGQSNDIEFYRRESNSAIVHNRTNGGTTTSITAPIIPKDIWTHVIITYDSSRPSGTINRWKVYYNGILQTVTNSSGSGEAPSAVNTRWQIGQNEHNDFGTNKNFSGKIEEIAIWNRALTDTEARLLYNKGASKIGIKYRSCDDSNCEEENWSDYNYSSTNIDLSSLTQNNYFQWAMTTSTYTFTKFYPRGCYSISGSSTCSNFYDQTACEAENGWEGDCYWTEGPNYCKDNTSIGYVDCYAYSGNSYECGLRDPTCYSSGYCNPIYYICEDVPYPDCLSYSQCAEAGCYVDYYFEYGYPDCYYMPYPDCTSNPGCYDGGWYCYGTPACYNGYDESSCYSQYGCSWSYGGEKCTGNIADGCYYNGYDEYSCNSMSGCYWYVDCYQNDSCSSMTTQEETLCNSTYGCYWGNDSYCNYNLGNQIYCFNVDNSTSCGYLSNCGWRENEITQYQTPTVLSPTLTDVNITYTK